MIRRTLTCLVLAAALMAPGCKKSERGSPESVTTRPSPRDALTEQLMLALGQAKNFHHKADVYLRDGRVDQAMAEIRNILALDFPPDSPEAEDVTADASARLGQLLVKKGQTDEAMRLVDSAIASASRESFFVANLHTVRGEVFEAMAKTASDAGGKDNPEARRLRLEAIKAFDRSIVINEALLKKLSGATK